MPGTLQDWISLGQGAAITVAFLFVTYKVPGLIIAYYAWVERADDKKVAEAARVREHETQKDEMDRAARHRMAEGYQKALADTIAAHRQDIREIVTGLDKQTAAIHELAMAQKDVCRIVHGHGGQQERHHEGSHT